MNRLALIAVLCSESFFVASAFSAEIEFSLINEEIFDAPVKTQIVQEILAAGIPSASEVKAELRERFLAAKNRSGFKYHNQPTNIYIYVYGTKEQASAGKGLWIGMLAHDLGDKGEPDDIRVNTLRLTALSTPSEFRFGLSEDKRKELFGEIAAAESRSTRDARARIPDSRFMEQLDLESELEEKYKAVLIQKYGLDSDQLLEITVEGVTKGWVY